ncbi:MAG: tetratricopeptide repeat protein [Planctomycetota bacterium]|nr:tetratricopeptide repeat protein [Planctomycetota bacterium]
MHELLEQGRALHKAGQLGEAEAIYRRLLELDPHSVPAHDMLGNVLFDQGQAEAAADCYRRALTLDSQQAPLHYRLGNALFANQQLDEAAACYLRAIELAPQLAAAHFNLGAVYSVQERWEAAVACYRRVLETDPARPNPGVALNLGRAYHALGRLAESIAAYRQAVQGLPEHPAAHSSLAAVLLQAGEAEESLASHQRALELAPQDASEHFKLGLTLRELGRNAEAEAALRRAIELKPGFLPAYDCLRELLEQAGKIGEIEALVTQLLGVPPDDPIAVHMKTSWTGRDVPARASDAYVRRVFDQYAPDFDAAMAKLSYRAPQLLADLVSRRARQGGQALEILDAGCGTGLCGSLLRPHARRLVGMDLSREMLDRARRLGVYDELAEAELTEYLDACPASFDWIVSADTLIYFGDLLPVFLAAARALRGGGLFAFSVEQLAADADFRLHARGRYCHSEAYVRRSLAAAGFTLDAMERAVLRTDLGQPVTGLIVAATRGTPAKSGSEAVGASGETSAAHAAEALLELTRRVTREPANAEARYDLARALLQAGQPEAALAQTQEAFRLRPPSTELLNNLGGLLEQLAQTDDALACYRRAVALSPEIAVPHFNLGDLLRRTGQLDEAAAALRTAATLDPNLAEAWTALGVTLLAAEQPRPALGALRRAVELRPEDDVACRRLGDALQALGQVADAIPYYERAARSNPRSVGTWYGWGHACGECRRWADALGALRRCLELDPDYAPAIHDLGWTLFQLGCLEEALLLLRQAADSGVPDVRSRALQNLAVLVPGSAADDHQAVLETRRRAWQERAPHGPQSPRIRPRRAGRVRIGYISSFFHCPNWMKPVWALINHHDRDRFQIHLFSDSPPDQPRTGYRPQASDCWCDISGQANPAAAAAIAAQDLDLLVDLNGYSAVQRLPIYALHPAPLLVGWFNMYATSGSAAYDYLIGDEHVVRSSEEPFYTERILRVPHSYLTFQVDYPVPDVAPSPVLRTGQLTIGCLASQYKLTDRVVETWAEILRRSPGVRMLIRNATLDRPEHQSHLRERFASWGISAKRLELESPAEHYEFLETYSRIDFAVDPFPYSGGTTTMEALWQGVPVVTFDEDRWAGRTSLSLLKAAGLDEFVGRDRQDYVEICVRLANASETPARLQTFRDGIRQRLRQSPVCDAASFAQAMESLYERILSERGPSPATGNNLPNSM